MGPRLGTEADPNQMHILKQTIHNKIYRNCFTFLRKWENTYKVFSIIQLPRASYTQSIEKGTKNHLQKKKGKTFLPNNLARLYLQLD